MRSVRKIDISAGAEQDIATAYLFYEAQAEGLGISARDSLLGDIQALEETGGIHPQHFGHFRKLASRFPFAIYYLIQADRVVVNAVLDCRRNPKRIRTRLT